MDGHAESALHALRRESIAQALHTLRLSESTTLRHSFLDPRRPAYQRAVAVVLADLRRSGSVADLVAYCAMERVVLHAAVTAACADADDARLLASAVEGAAFWRRVRELVAEAVA